MKAERSSNAKAAAAPRRTEQADKCAPAGDRKTQAADTAPSPATEPLLPPRASGKSSGAGRTPPRQPLGTLLSGRRASRPSPSGLNVAEPDQVLARSHELSLTRVSSEYDVCLHERPDPLAFHEVGSLEANPRPTYAIDPPPR